MYKAYNRFYSVSIFILFAVAIGFFCGGIFAPQCRAEEGDNLGWHGPYPYKPPVFGYNEKYDNAKIIKRYDKTNADEVKGLVPDFMIEWLKDREKWGPFYINEMEHITYEPPEAYGAATKKYAGTCKVSPDGQLLNWVAGQPFSDPKTG